MITRNWTGVVKYERASDYITHFQNDTLPRLSTIEGFRKATIQQRSVTDGIEFLVVTYWDTLDAVKEFSGEAYDIPVIAAVAQEMLVRYDPVVRHYEDVKMEVNQLTGLTS